MTDQDPKNSSAKRNRIAAIIVAGVLAAGLAVAAFSVGAGSSPSPQPVAAVSPASSTQTPTATVTLPSPPTPASPASAGAHSATPMPNVLMIGDSIMKGFGVQPAQAWPAILASQDDWNLTTLACNGAGFLAIGAPGDCNTNFPGVVRAAAADHPDIVIIEGSSNDFGLDNTSLAGSTTDALATLRAEFPVAKIIGLSTVWEDTAPPAQLADTNAQVSAAVTAVGGTFIDIGQPLSGQPALLQDDDVHPTVDGQVVLARAISAALGAIVAAAK